MQMVWHISMQLAWTIIGVEEGSNHRRHMQKVMDPMHNTHTLTEQRSSNKLRMWGIDDHDEATRVAANIAHRRVVTHSLCDTNRVLCIPGEDVKNLSR